jgi:hypothetical protein
MEGEDMLTVTEPALERLSRRLTRKGGGEGMAMRFTRVEGGWSLDLDKESAGDTAYTHDGRTVLVLDETVSKAMANMTLDTRTNKRRSSLRLRRNDRSKA